MWGTAHPESFGPVAEPFLDGARCDEVIAAAGALGRWTDAGIYSSDAGGDLVDADERSASSIAAVDAGFPIGALVDALAAVNDQYFRYTLTSIPAGDAPSILRYSSASADHFRDHRDVGGFAPTRKLTYVVQLSPPDAYAGGDLVFSSLGTIATREQGSLIVFPAYEMHHVTPVLHGTRHTVVGWIHGGSLR